MPSKEWVSRSDVAKYYSVSISTIIRWERKGLPYHQVGHVKRYNIAECDQWFKERSSSADDSNARLLTT